jgi:hypothetical protein
MGLLFALCLLFFMWFFCDLSFFGAFIFTIVMYIMCSCAFC